MFPADDGSTTPWQTHFPAIFGSFRCTLRAKHDSPAGQQIDSFVGDVINLRKLFFFYLFFQTNIITLMQAYQQIWQKQNRHLIFHPFRFCKIFKSHKAAHYFPHPIMGCFLHVQIN